jgi:hypothetical protein
MGICEFFDNRRREEHTFLMGFYKINAYTVKPKAIFKATNALVKSEQYVTEYTICFLSTLQFYFPRITEKTHSATNIRQLQASYATKLQSSATK